MALRLTGTTLAPQSSAGSWAGATASAVQLAAQARTLLAAGEHDRYRDLFVAAGEIQDPDGRYHARAALLEQGLLAGGQPNAARAIGAMLVVVQSAVVLLEQEPREPVLLNYAAVAMYELWSLDAARALFRAAARLDPSLPHVQRNLAECDRRRRERHNARPLHPALPGLARRAKLAASKAMPVKGLTLSLCMIVRDEEQMLGRCLTAVAPAVDELIVVDTGSSDSTIEIARSFGARVIEYPWTGSFAEARNVSFAAASGDWLLYLDADEILVAEDAQQLRALTGHAWREAFYLVETSHMGEIGDGAAVTNNALRVFRNRPQYRFEGRLHEQIAHHLPFQVPGRIEQTTVRVEHYGYLGAVRDAKQKFQRNIELLRAQAAESAPTAFLHFNLGSEYAAAGDPAPACRELERAWSMILAEDSADSCEFAPPLVVRLVNALRLCGRVQEATSRATDGLARYPTLTDLVFEQATISVALGDREAAAAYYRRCIELGDAPARYGGTVGCGTYLPRLGLAELALARGEAAAARELLDWCLERHPGFFGVVAPYATALLRDGVAPDDVVAEIERRIAQLTPTVQFMLASALRRAGALEAAERKYRAVLVAEPDSAQVRVALAETLLSLGRYADASQEAAMLAEVDSFAGLACRIELCGLIAGGDLKSAREAILRTTRVGLPGIEREVFEAWIAIADGAPVARSLPVAGIPLLVVVLENLLQARDFKAFERLLPALERSELPVREQRELLGAAYLRHGYLASAAKEWMAVCSEQPDARALVGLACVAAAHGQGEDAATFAAGALELDPANATASELLAGHQPAAVTA
jgi:tetratricopeptide (TPR) repeat protein